jgi:hypothetical protein
MSERPSPTYSQLDPHEHEYQLGHLHFDLSDAVALDHRHAERARRGDRAAIIARLGEIETAMAPHAANVEAFERESTWPELFDLDG